MNKHTPEPWEALSSSIVDADNEQLCRFLDRDYNDLENSDANAHRIVACVNACAGMENPVFEIEQLRANHSALIRDLERIQKMADEAAVKYTPHQESELSELYHAVTELIFKVQEGRNG